MSDNDTRLMELQTTREYFVKGLERIHKVLLYLEYALGDGAFYAPMPWIMSVSVTDDEITMGVRLHDSDGKVSFVQAAIVFCMSPNAKKLNIKAFAKDAMFNAYLNRLVDEINGWWQIGGGGK